MAISVNLTVNVVFPELDSAHATLEDCKQIILTSQKAHQLGRDERDNAFSEIRRHMQSLEEAIVVVKSWTDSPEGSSESPVEKPLKKVMIMFSKLKKNREESPLKMALEKVDEAHRNLKAQLIVLEETTKKRSPVKKLGSYHTLGGMKTLISVHCDSSFDLKGRYEDTGNRLFELVTVMVTIENRLKSRKELSKPKSEFDRATPILKDLHFRLASRFSETISFMLAVPFDLRAFDLVEKEISRLVAILRYYVEGIYPLRGLFETVTIETDAISRFQDNYDDEPDENPFRDEDPLDSVVSESVTALSLSSRSSGNTPDKNVLRFEQLKLDMNAITQFLASREAKYKEKKLKFEVSPQPLPAFERAIPKFGLKPGDLRNTEMVLDCMKRSSSHSMGGLGLTEICKSNKVQPKTLSPGGYGVVSCMELPDDAKGVDSIKAANRLVAVKIASGSLDEATKNLRMLREADRWVSVSSDPRKLVDGGQYLAEVLGIWDDFQNGRPGLVSLWGSSMLSDYVKDKKAELTESHRLELASKVAQGVLYLHTCNPVIVHGDIKGANVVMVDGEPRITDFGIAKCLDERPGYTTRDESYSDFYRAPEIQYRTISLVRYPSRKSDVYAFGCLLFETLSGKAPYKGITAEVRKEWINSNLDYTPLDANSSEEDKDPFSFEAEHVELMKWCFNFHALRRPTMKEVVDELQKLC